MTSLVLRDPNNRYDHTDRYNSALIILKQKSGESNRVFTQISAFCESFETTLDHLGYMVLISNLSAVGRGFFGVALVISSLATLAFMILKEALYMLSFTQKPEFSCVLYAFHGAANMVRAIVESVPYFGNVVCGIYNISGHRLLY